MFVRKRGIVQRDGRRDGQDKKRSLGFVQVQDALCLLAACRANIVWRSTLVCLWAFEGFMARCDSAANRFQMPPVWELGSREGAAGVCVCVCGGKGGGVITRCDPLQSGMFSMDSDNMCLHLCACVAETEGWNIHSAWHPTDRQTGREITDSTLFHAAPASICHAHPLPRHGVHGSSRLVQHICCWQRRASTYGSTLRFQAKRWGSDQELACSRVAYYKGKLSAGPFKVPNRKHW